MLKPSLQFKLLANISLVLLLQSSLFLMIAYFELSLSWSIPLALVISLIFVWLFLAVFLSPIKSLILALEVGVNAFKDKDFSITIHDDKYKEFSLIIDAYNDLSKVLRDERMAIYQRELLLDTVIQSTPVALILTNNHGHIVYSNIAAKTLLNQNARLEGMKFTDIMKGMPADLYQASMLKQDGLFTEKLDDEMVVYNLNCQTFNLNSKPHHLYLYKNLTAEISRKENDIWKQVIRLISHELNNSLAPITSLTNSAQKIVKSKDNYHMLPDMLSTISRRSSHLHQFIAQYANFARLPKPQRKPVKMDSFLASIEHICHIEIATNQTEFATNKVTGDKNSQIKCSNGQSVEFDATQIEQVLINLIKNAKESGSPLNEVKLYVEKLANEMIFTLVDRGKGMTESQLQQALLPFFTTKVEGTGVGLALCNEIVIAHGGKLRIGNRENGGLSVTFSLKKPTDL